MPQHRNGKERVVGKDEEAGDCGDVDDKTFLFWTLRNGRIVPANKSDDDRVIEMTGGGGLLVTLVIDFYENDDDDDDDDSDDDDDEEPRIGIHARNDKSNVAYCWRATHIHGRVSLSLSLSRYFCYCLLMMMRERESNDDAPGGRGTQRNSTIKHGTRNRTDEHDKPNERKTAFFSSASFFSLILFLLPSFILFFSLLPVAYEWSGGVGSRERRVHTCVYSGEDKRTNIGDIFFCVLACILLLQQFSSKSS